MANKATMKCNKVVASDRAGKKKMVKACQDGQEKRKALPHPEEALPGRGRYGSPGNGAGIAQGAAEHLPGRS